MRKVSVCRKANFVPCCFCNSKLERAEYMSAGRPCSNKPRHSIYLLCPLLRTAAPHHSSLVLLKGVSCLIVFGANFLRVIVDRNR